MGPRGGTADKLAKSLDEIIHGDPRAFGRGGRRKAVSSSRSRSPRRATRLPCASGRRVFVGNLAYSVEWQDLKDHMRRAGRVVHCDILPAPGTALGSKGCGVVEYATSEEANRAIDELTDTLLKGRPIWIREDREAGKGSARAGAGPPARAREGIAAGVGGVGCSVFVGNLAFSADWKDLKDHMRAAGEVVHADVVKQAGTACGSKGCGLVRYATPAAARRAIRTLTDTMLRGRPIFVREDREEDAFASRGRPAPPPRAEPAARPQPSRALLAVQGGARGEVAALGVRVRTECRVFVGNLPYSVSWQELKDHMRKAGTVVTAEIIAEPGTPCNSKGCGVVQYSTPEEAERAVRIMSESVLKGRNILCRMEKF